MGSANGGDIHGFSLNVERQLKVTVTLLGAPRFLVLSRPVGKLSPTKVIRIEGLLGSLGGRCKVAVLISDRVLRRLCRATARFVLVSGKGVVRRVSSRRLGRQYGQRVTVGTASPRGTLLMLRRGLRARGFGLVPSKAVHLCSCLSSLRGITTILSSTRVLIAKLSMSNSALRSCFLDGVKNSRGIGSPGC